MQNPDEQKGHKRNYNLVFEEIGYARSIMGTLTFIDGENCTLGKSDGKYTIDQSKKEITLTLPNDETDDDPTDTINYIVKYAKNGAELSLYVPDATDPSTYYDMDYVYTKFDPEVN